MWFLLQKIVFSQQYSHVKKLEYWDGLLIGTHLKQD